MGRFRLRAVESLAVLLVVGWGGSRACRAAETGEPGIIWATDFESALEEAQIEGKLVMVDFYTDWCGWCRRLDSDTYRDADVAARARRLVCVRVNAERRTEVARRYGVRGYPTIVFLHANGDLVDVVRGYLPPKQFLPVLDRLTDSGGERFTLLQRLKDHPDLVDVREDLARLMIREGQPAAALAEIDTCLQREGLDDASRWDLRLDHGRLLAALGRTHEARKELKGYVDRRRGSARHAEALFFYAEVCLADRDWKEARKSYRKVLEERPQGWLAARSRSRLNEIGP